MKKNQIFKFTIFEKYGDKICKWGFRRQVAPENQFSQEFLWYPALKGKF